MKVCVKSFFISMGITLILLLILSILLAKTELAESTMNIGIIFSSSVSILIGGFLIGKDRKKNGILYGAIFGFAYMFTLYLISSCLNFNFIITLETIFMCLAGVLGGIIGGIIGVNL